MLESCASISKLFEKLKNKLDTEIIIHTSPIWKIPQINENSTLGEQIKYYRRLANIKQTDLCLKLGCDRGVLDHLENRELKLVNVKLIKDISVIKKWETGKSQMTRASYNKLKKCMS